MVTKMVTIVKYILISVIIQTVNSNLVWDTTNPALDQSLYEEAIDPVLCEEQLNYVIQDTILRLQFLDAGIRIPKGILEGNLLDLGNYHQCLGINRQLEDSELQGKYCQIRVPFNQTLNIPQLSGLSNLQELDINEIKARFQGAHEMKLGARRLGVILNNDTRLAPGSPFASMELSVAVCVPKSCSTQQAINSLLFNISAFGFEFSEEFCRLPNDKPWVAADYVAVVLLSLIGVLSLMSTVYDVLVQFVFKNVPPKSMYKTFSIYTNGQRLMNFTTGPDALHCLDGIRALAMIWVVIGHTFVTESFWLNPATGFQWATSLEGLWVTSAHITVDTFFTLSGLLVVYTTAGKLSGKKLLQNLHFFYLNRLLRMFPVLATGVLLEASVFNRISDGPNWGHMSGLVNTCRTFWWSALLHMQNYMNPDRICLSQSWYLAIDVQLHILSPLVLFWVLSGSRKIAWLGLAIGFLLHLSAASVYNFIMEFPLGMLNQNPGDDASYYINKYYINTLTRASPFLVGMIIGYILSLYRGKRVRLSKVQVILNYAWATPLFCFIIYSTYPIVQPEWDNQTLNNLYNSFIRPAWALSLGWLIFACVHGYAGPINWFLSLRIWKLPARLSYAMYILHFGLMVAVNSSAVTPPLFSVNGVLFKFSGHFTLVFMVSFIVVLFIDAPCSVLVKKLLSIGTKKQKKPVEEPEAAKDTGKEV